MSQFIEQLKSFYSSLDKTKQRLLWAAIGLTLAAIIGVSVLANRTNYEVLLSNQETAIIKEAAATLDAQKIPYRILGDGRTLEVPSQYLGQARVNSAAAGLPAGFSLLKEIGTGFGPQRERWYYNQALQGELERTILSLQEVEGVRIHIVSPEQNAFYSDEEDASASVVLKLRSGATLTQSQVRGISSLIAGAVRGLSPAGVEITDSTGKLLTNNADDEENAISQTIREERLRLEKKHRESIEETLSGLFGTSGVRAVVAIELETSSVQKTANKLDANVQAVSGESIYEEESKGTSAGGVPGAQSNLPENVAQTSSGKSDEKTSSKTSTNYIYPTEVTHTVIPAGDLRKISASVTIDSNKIKALVAAEGGPTEENLRAQITKLIEGAIGYNASRGDSIALVTDVPFYNEESETTTALGFMESNPNVIRFAPYLLMLVGLVLAFLFVIRPIMDNLTKTKKLEADLAKTAKDGFANTSPDQNDPLSIRLKKLVDNFQPVDAKDLNRLVDSETHASSNVIRHWLRSA